MTTRIVQATNIYDPENVISALSYGQLALKIGGTTSGISYAVRHGRCYKEWWIEDIYLTHEANEKITEEDISTND